MQVHGKIIRVDKKIGKTRIKRDGTEENMKPIQLLSVSIQHTVFLTVPLSMKNVGQLWDIVQSQYPDIEAEQLMKVADAANFLTEFIQKNKVEIDVNLQERQLDGVVYITAKFLEEG